LCIINNSYSNFYKITPADFPGKGKDWEGSPLDVKLHSQTSLTVVHQNAWGLKKQANC
jgi:hypothetical protein